MKDNGDDALESTREEQRTQSNKNMQIREGQHNLQDDFYVVAVPLGFLRSLEFGAIVEKGDDDAWLFGVGWWRYQIDFYGHPGAASLATRILGSLDDAVYFLSVERWNPSFGSSR